ncbi:hypothetical protein ASPCAL03355 [Aspergillus calidoustus]|uniref:Uncharacterized protein n=1 Tax=Aspergillus calidoustus TaxID=454130 RepID=A0A0U5FU44_ASPCI|nr:hypothetical protein ASPCAL03355 [Aspergillus calidoustus]
MHDLVELPVEFLDTILKYAYDIDSNPSEPPDQQQLTSLLLVSRKWHQAFLPRVYSSWSFNGACHTYRSLWCFLRTVLTCPHIANLVQTLDVGNWGHGTPFYLSSDTFEVSVAESTLLSEGIRGAGMHHLEYDILKNFPPSALALADHRPLMALLLVNLKNVAIMYAHIPNSDPYLRAALDRLLKGSRLDKLQELYLIPEVPIFDRNLRGSPGYERDTTNFHRLQLDGVWPLLFQPRLRTLSMDNLDTENVASILQPERSKRGCAIEELHISSHKQSKCLPDDVHALLTLPKALRSISFYWHNYKFKHGPAKKDTTCKVSNQQIWDMLHKHMSRLESVDIMHGTDNSRHWRRDHFSSLAFFARLRSLAIQAEVLFGSDPSLLDTTLPASLEVLMLFTSTVRTDCLSGVLRALTSVIGKGLPRLTELWVNDERLAHTDHHMADLQHELQETCTNHGVRLTLYPYADPPFRSGALCRRHWQRTSYLQNDGFRRLTLTHEHQLERGNPIAGESDEEPSYPLWPSAFPDHKGAQSFTIYENNDPQKCLHPLISFAIYFTHPAAGYPQTDMCGLFNLILQEMANFHFRLDMYFLPNASKGDCIMHYRAEKATARKSHVVLDLVERRLRNRLTQPPSLRGRSEMMDEYVLDGKRWGGALCICEAKDWAKNGERLFCMLFDTLDQEASAEPSTWEELLPISATSPGAETTSETAAAWMYDLAYPLRDRCVEARKAARKRGWRCWV